MRMFRFLAVAVCALSAGTLNAGLLSPTDGDIRTVFIAVPPDDVDETAQLSALAAGSLSMIARTVGPDVRYIVHAYPEHQSIITNELSKAGVVNIRYAPSAFGYYTRWTRDMFVVRNTAKTTQWLLPDAMRRRLDGSVGAEVAAHIGQAVKQLPYDIEGGNIITFGAWVFAGKDLLLDGPDSIDSNRRQQLQQALAPDSNWIWIGNEHAIPYDAAVGIFQPLFHIDMFLTPVHQPSSARPHLVIGSTELAQTLTGKVSLPGLAARIEEVVDYLRRAGFTVSRVPLLVFNEEDAVSVVNYNNVLFAGKTGRIAMVPQYASGDPSLKVMDDYTVDHYQQLGYTVRPVTGPLLELGWQLGGLRCLIQVVERR